MKKIKNKIIEISLENAKYLVLDEADKLFEGSFLSQIDEIIASCTNSEIQRGLFSATLPTQVLSLVSLFSLFLRISSFFSFFPFFFHSLFFIESLFFFEG